MNNEFKIYTSNTCQISSNCVYQNELIITDETSAKKAFSNDYVCAKYKENKRKNENFISSNIIAFDIDNDHSEKENEWITVDIIKENFKDVPFLVHYSRNNQIEKKGKKARPKFHVLFLSNTIYNAKDYTNIKLKTFEYFPYFDKNALDASRFFFGTENAKVEFVSGNILLSDFLDRVILSNQNIDKSINTAQNKDTLSIEKNYADTNLILEGSRNTTMFKYAIFVLNNYSINQAKEMFDKKSKFCSPLLEEKELNSIWSSAKNYTQNNHEFNYKPTTDYSLTAEANIFGDFLKDKLIYVDKDYYFFNSKYWERNNNIIEQLYSEFTSLQLNEANLYFESIKKIIKEKNIGDIIMSKSKKVILSDDELHIKNKFLDSKKYLEHVYKMRNLMNNEYIFNKVKQKIYKNSNDLNSDPYLFNTPDYTINLKTLEKYQHKASDYITMISSFSPCDEHKEELYKYLKTLFDNETINYIQMLLGKTLIGKNFKNQITIFQGPTNTGKSTLCLLVANVLNNYASSISADIFVQNKYINIEREMSKLENKRFVYCNEVDENSILNSVVLKRLTSEEKIWVEQKYIIPHEINITWDMFLTTNYSPKIVSDDGAIWNRIIRIPFEKSIKSIDSNFIESFTKSYGSALISWLIDGAFMFIKNEYKLPKIINKIKKSLTQYKSEDDLENYLEENIIFDKNNRIETKILYKNYLAFCDKHLQKPLSNNMVTRLLSKRGVERKRGHDKVYYYGIRFK